jgi:uncharacterized membrane protein
MFVLPILGAILFFSQIRREHPWLDETYSAAMAAHSFGDILRIAVQDVHPPLYYLGLKAATVLLGSGELGLRFLSALFAVGLVALGMGPVRRIFGEKAAYIYMALTIFSPGILCFAQEARMYTMAAFFVLGAALYGIEAVQSGQKGAFVRFGVCMSAAMYTHYFSLLAVAVAASILLGYVIVREKRLLKSYLVTTGFTAIVYLPWVPSFLTQIQRVKAGFWIPKTDWFLVKFSLMAPYAYKYEDISFSWFSVAAMVLSTLIIGFCIWSYRKNKEVWLPLMFLMSVHVLTIAAGRAISFAASDCFS